MTEKLTEYQNKLLSETLCKMVLDGATPDKIKEATRLLTKQMVQLNASSFSENLCSATVAIEDGEYVSDASPKLSLQNGLDPLVEAALANVVSGLRMGMESRVAFYWVDIGRMCKVVSTRDSLDRTIFFLLQDGFLQFHNFLSFFQDLVLGGNLRRLSVDQLSEKLEDARRKYIGEVAKTFKFDYPEHW